MKSGYPSEEQVVDDLGDKVVEGLGLMVAQTREDLRVYRTTFPRWTGEATERGLLSWCHDRAWAHATNIFDGVREVVLVDRPPIRELYVGIHYRLRIKKHDEVGRVTTYPTAAALNFMEQEPTLDGLEVTKLIAGYIWDSDLRAIGAPVLTLRDGQDNILWTHFLPEPPSVAVTTVSPILPPTEPSAPTIELVTDGAEKPAEETNAE